MHHRHFGHGPFHGIHPAVAAWWNARRAGHCGEGAGCSPEAGPPGHDHGPGPGRGAFFGGWGGPPFPGRGHGPGDGGDDPFGGGAFGVRRPLRFLAHKLELDEPQVAKLAGILNDLKTERAQAAVDDRRTTSAFADAIAEGTWDEAKAKTAAELRVKSAEQLRDAVVKALGRIHELLDPEQREKLAYLIRTGTISI